MEPRAAWRATQRFRRRPLAQHPHGHRGDAWHVACACLHLAMDESKYVTGIELIVDGGITLKYS